MAEMAAVGAGGIVMELRVATLHTDGWAGRHTQACEVVGETPKYYRVRAVMGAELRLPFRGRGVRTVLRSGTALVPKGAVTFQDGL
jgi:hypothetical protein